MAQILVDFNASTAGGLPDGWTRRHAVTETGWTITNAVAYDGTSKGMVSHFTAAARNVLTYDAADALSANMEVFTRFKCTSGSLADARIMLRASGSAGSEVGYSLGCVNNGLRISKSVAGASTNFGTDYSFGPSANTWYNLVARVNGTALSVKMWAEGDSEPGSWQKTATDSSITAAGWNGIYQFVVNGDNTFDRYFGFGTAGDAAPRTPPMQGTATGGFAFAGTAAGQTTRSGTATDGFLFTGSATGSKAQSGTAASGWAYASTATGSAALQGAGVGGFTFAGAANGTTPAESAKSGNAAGSWNFTSSASGIGAYSGASSGGYSFTGAAIGTTPAEAVKAGSATGAITWAATAIGSTATSGTGNGTYAWTGLAEGDNGRAGLVEGTYTWTGTADGIGSYSGDATGTITWTGGGFAPLPDFPNPVTVKVFASTVRAAVSTGQLVTVRIYE